MKYARSRATMCGATATFGAPHFRSAEILCVRPENIYDSRLLCGTFDLRKLDAGADSQTRINNGRSRSLSISLEFHVIEKNNLKKNIVNLRATY